MRIGNTSALVFFAAMLAGITINANTDRIHA